MRWSEEDLLNYIRSPEAKTASRRSRARGLEPTEKDLKEIPEATDKELARAKRAGTGERVTKRTREEIRKYINSPEFKAFEDELNNARRPVKQPVTVRLDPDVIDWLKSKPGPYQTRLNHILRVLMRREREGA